MADGACPQPPFSLYRFLLGMIACLVQHTIGRGWEGLRWTVSVSCPDSEVIVVSDLVPWLLVVLSERFSSV